MRRTLREPEIAFLAKPFEPVALLGTVESMLKAVA